MQHGEGITPLNPMDPPCTQSVFDNPGALFRGPWVPTQHLTVKQMITVLMRLLIVLTATLAFMTNGRTAALAFMLGFVILLAIHVCRGDSENKPTDDPFSMPGNEYFGPTGIDHFLQQGFPFPVNAPEIENEEIEDEEEQVEGFAGHVISERAAVPNMALPNMKPQKLSIGPRNLGACSGLFVESAHIPRTFRNSVNGNTPRRKPYSKPLQPNIRYRDSRTMPLSQTANHTANENVRLEIAHQRKRHNTERDMYAQYTETQFARGARERARLSRNQPISSRA